MGEEGHGGAFNNMRKRARAFLSEHAVSIVAVLALALSYILNNVLG